MGRYIESMEDMFALMTSYDTVYPSHGLFPVSASIVVCLIPGAKKVMAGEIQGEAPSFETDAKLYDVNVAKFLY